MNRLQPVTPEIAELFDYTLRSFWKARLMVGSAIDKATGETRYVLLSDHNGKMVPVGYLSNTVGDEVYPPGYDPNIVTIILDPDRPEESELLRWADDGGPA